MIGHFIWFFFIAHSYCLVPIYRLYNKLINLCWFFWMDLWGICGFFWLFWGIFLDGWFIWIVFFLRIWFDFRIWFVWYFWDLAILGLWDFYFDWFDYSFDAIADDGYMMIIFYDDYFDRFSAFGLLFWMGFNGIWFMGIFLIFWIWRFIRRILLGLGDFYLFIWILCEFGWMGFFLWFGLREGIGSLIGFLIDAMWIYLRGFIIFFFCFILIGDLSFFWDLGFIFGFGIRYFWRVDYFFWLIYAMIYRIDIFDFFDFLDIVRDDI